MDELEIRKKIKDINKKLDVEIIALGKDPEKITVAVTSTRRYPDGNYRWTSAYYDGVDIDTYSIDPRQPGMSNSEMTTIKWLELQVAKRAFIKELTQATEEVA